MSIYAQRCADANNYFGDKPAKPRRKAWFDVSLVEMLRPECYWPHPYTLEQAFEIFRWMVAKGKDYSTPQRWGPVGVWELLSATSGCNLSSVDPIHSLPDLRKRFHYALLGLPRAESIARWRADHGISPVGKFRVAAPIYTPFAGARHLGWTSESSIHDDFARVTEGCHGQRMALPLNYAHLDCRYLHRVVVQVSPDAFRFVLTFGEDPAGNRHASYWDKTVAATRPGESFLDTFARARDVFDVLVSGVVKPCDPTELLESCQYGMRWHRAFVTAFIAGDRTEPDFRALREAEYAENAAAAEARKAVEVAA